MYVLLGPPAQLYEQPGGPWGGAGGSPGGSDGERTGGVGETGTGERPAAGDPWRERGDQGGKSGSGTDGRRADVEGVPGRGKLPERTILGSFAHKLEWGSAHTRTGRGIFSDTGQTRREEFGKG